MTLGRLGAGCLTVARGLGDVTEGLDTGARVTEGLDTGERVTEGWRTFRCVGGGLMAPVRFVPTFDRRKRESVDLETWGRVLVTV